MKTTRIIGKIRELAILFIFCFTVTICVGQRVCPTSSYKDVIPLLPKATEYYSVRFGYQDSVLKLNFISNPENSPFFRKTMMICTKHSLSIN